MFRCDNCGSGYSARAAAWESCPRCYAKEGTNVPLNFEIGWRRPSHADVEARPEQLDLQHDTAADANSRPAATA